MDRACNPKVCPLQSFLNHGGRLHETTHAATQKRRTESNATSSIVAAVRVIVRSLQSSCSGCVRVLQGGNENINDTGWMIVVIVLDVHLARMFGLRTLPRKKRVRAGHSADTSKSSLT